MISAREIREWLLEEIGARDEFPAYLKMRLVEKGPFVPAKIGFFCICTPVGGDDEREHEWSLECDRPKLLSAVVDGQSKGIDTVLRGWQVREIQKDEYDLLSAQSEWDKRYDPEAPLAKPTSRVNFNRMKIGF